MTEKNSIHCHLSNDWCDLGVSLSYNAKRKQRSIRGPLSFLELAICIYVFLGGIQPKGTNKWFLLQLLSDAQKILQLQVLHLFCFPKCFIRFTRPGLFVSSRRGSWTKASHQCALVENGSQDSFPLNSGMCFFHGAMHKQNLKLLLLHHHHQNINEWYLWFMITARMETYHS